MDVIKEVMKVAEKLADMYFPASDYRHDELVSRLTDMYVRGYDNGRHDAERENSDPMVMEFSKSAMQILLGRSVAVDSKHIDFDGIAEESVRIAKAMVNRINGYGDEREEV